MTNRAKEQLKCRILIASVPPEQQGNRLGSDPGAWERAYRTHPHHHTLAFHLRSGVLLLYHSLETAKHSLQSSLPADHGQSLWCLIRWLGGLLRDAMGTLSSSSIPEASHLPRGTRVESKENLYTVKGKNPCVGVTFEPNKDLVHRLWHSILGS